ncbi:MAG: hypothetical protein Q4F15_00085 [Bacillota bacterium]|nr:hypothetical protein [Bacillota bacterium]
MQYGSYGLAYASFEAACEGYDEEIDDLTFGSMDAAFNTTYVNGNAHVKDGEGNLYVTAPSIVRLASGYIATSSGDVIYPYSLAAWQRIYKKDAEFGYFLSEYTQKILYWFAQDLNGEELSSPYVYLLGFRVVHICLLCLTDRLSHASPFREACLLYGEVCLLLGYQYSSANAYFWKTVKNNAQKYWKTVKITLYSLWKTGKKQYVSKDFFIHRRVFDARLKTNFVHRWGPPSR